MRTRGGRLCSKVGGIYEREVGVDKKGVFCGGSASDKREQSLDFCGKYNFRVKGVLQINQTK